MAGLFPNLLGFIMIDLKLSGLSAEIKNSLRDLEIQFSDFISKNSLTRYNDSVKSDENQRIQSDQTNDK